MSRVVWGVTYDKVVVPYSKMVYPMEVSQNGVVGPNLDATRSSKGWEKPNLKL